MSEGQLLLRTALGELLPTAVRRAVHARPSLPRGAWVALLEDTLTPERIAAQGFFRPETVKRLRDEHLHGRCDHAARLWAIVLATRWLERRTLPAVPAIRAAG